MSVADALKGLAGVQITSTTLKSFSIAKYSIRKFQCGIGLGFLTSPVWELKARCLFLFASLHKRQLLWVVTKSWLTYFCDFSGAFKQLAC